MTRKTDISCIRAKKSFMGGDSVASALALLFFYAPAVQTVLAGIMRIWIGL
jgi:hypothetical protein